MGELTQSLSPGEVLEITAPLLSHLGSNHVQEWCEFFENYFLRYFQPKLPSEIYSIVKWKCFNYILDLNLTTHITSKIRRQCHNISVWSHQSSAVIVSARLDAGRAKVNQFLVHILRLEHLLGSLCP